MMDASPGTFTLLGIFLMGLGLNLTPCVYPMLSITVSLFTAQKTSGRWESVARACLYVLGIATMYSSLGVSAAFTGHLFGSFLQNRWVLLAVGVMIFVFALSLFGLYTFRLPSWLLSKMGGKRGQGLWGVYLSGLFVGIFAAPCVGPPILGLLTWVATRGSPLFAFWIFFVMSLGLGAPYLLLGSFSGFLQRLPKAGPWLVLVERIFGVVLLALSGFYLLLALHPAWLSALLPTVLVAGGFCLGFIERSEAYSPSVIKGKRILGGLAILAGLAWPFFIPRQGLQWERYSPEKLSEAKAAHQPVIMDFYADWCLPCHELDRFTYANPQVIQALAGFKKLKVDLTRPDTPEAEEVVGRFHILGVPTILFLDRDGAEVEEARTTGFISAQELLAILRLARFSPKNSPSP